MICAESASGAVLSHKMKINLFVGSEVFLFSLEHFGHTIKTIKTSPRILFGHFNRK